MKYVILIHSNPQPWGHPTGDFNAEFMALPPSARDEMSAAFDRLLGELTESGELLGGEALGDPASATIYRWSDGPVAGNGPFAKTKERFAGFFLLEVADRERAEEIAARFASPGDVIELRPAT